MSQSLPVYRVRLWASPGPTASNVVTHLPEDDTLAGPHPSPLPQRRRGDLQSAAFRLLNFTSKMSIEDLEIRTRSVPPFMHRLRQLTLINLDIRTERRTPSCSSNTGAIVCGRTRYLSMHMWSGIRLRAPRKPWGGVE